MVSSWFKKGRNILLAPQASILSAATIIMLMNLVARLSGQIRLRVLGHYFIDEELALFFAAFRLPDLVFVVFTLGALSSAFIPVFAKTFHKKQKEAWITAGRIVNFGLIVFLGFYLVFGLFARSLYALIAPGFSGRETETIAYLARVLFAAQGFFVVSYVMTGVLESLKRFVVPALAPLFYNLGIILGTILFAPSMGLMAPAIGVVIGALAHFLVQLPIAYKLGFRFRLELKAGKNVKRIGRLATPRMIELGILQIAKTVELFLASLISTPAYTYYNFALSVQALPVGLFGLSIAKAALPTLAHYSNEPKKLKATFLNSLYQISFFVIPVVMVMIVLRIPIVRLLFGTHLFDWPATVQTGYVLSAFALGIFFQSVLLLLTRTYFAMHDTKTPVIVSVVGVIVNVIVSLVLVLGMGMSTWALALSYSVNNAFQAIVLYFLLSRKLNGGSLFALMPIFKHVLSAFLSGSVMFITLKFFDRSVWVKRLSFITNIQSLKTLNFENFVLDTRYSANLLLLTVVTAILGGIVYLAVNALLRTGELQVFLRVLRRGKFTMPTKEGESVSPTASDTSGI